MRIRFSEENTCPDCRAEISWTSIFDHETNRVTPFGDCNCDGRQWQKTRMDGASFADTGGEPT
jgi:hypothetical protein